MSDSNNAASELPDSLSERLKAARLSEVPQRTGHHLTDFMNSSQRMLEIQRRNLSDIESTYQIERIRLLDGYRTQIENLKFECAEALRSLDLKHNEDTADARKLVERLIAMRAMD